MKTRNEFKRLSLSAIIAYLRTMLTSNPLVLLILRLRPNMFFSASSGLNNHFLYICSVENQCGHVLGLSACSWNLSVCWGSLSELQW